jgi:formylglycine-generating enzyme required for sulfatase activity
VGQKRPNDLGLFDLHGNVWNWVADPGYRYPVGAGVVIDNEDIYSGKMIDISDSRSSRVLRGGSFNGHPSSVRSAQRNFGRPGNRNFNGGFRPARTCR